MVKNDLELGKKLFEFLPELKEWLEPYIPLEDFDKYLAYKYVDIEKDFFYKQLPWKVLINRKIYSYKTYSL